MRALPRLVGDPEAFAQDAWGTRPHLFGGQVDDDLSALLRLDDADHLLTEASPRTPQLRLVRDGEVIPARTWTHAPTLGDARLTGLVDVRAVLALVDDGATLVLQGLQRWWSPIGDLLAALEDDLGHPCQANAYLTPPDAQGFDWHVDGHDVFVVQTHGTKRWHVRHPRADALGHPSGGHAEEHAGAGNEAALELAPGDCLYLPRGTEHAPRALDRASLHVTIGVQPWTWRHVVDRIVRRTTDELDLDRPLPVGWHGEPDGFASALARHLDDLAGRLDDLDSSDVTPDLRVQAERFRTTRRTTLRGGLTDRLGHADLHDDDVVRRRGRAPAVVDVGDHARLLLPDRVVRVPAWVAEALREAVARTDLRPRDLDPWLNRSSRVVLVGRLVREGVFHRP